MINNKVGILTSTPSFHNNYGAVLQAYALLKQLELLGFEGFIIKYSGESEYIKGETSISKRIKGIFLNRETTLSQKVNTLLSKPRRDNNAKIFKKFQDDYLKFYNDDYVSFDDLKKNPPSFGAFICGSDQVWNPKIRGNQVDKGYFLDFVPKSIKRIAYAPSIGINKLPDNCIVDMKELLKKFDALSIREVTGTKEINEKCGINIPVVLDPTLLLSTIYWNQIENMPPNTPKDYILCYKFGTIRHTNKVIKEISKETGMPVIAIPASLDMSFKTRYDIGPREFISLIKNARIVCTDSFHASVFSILYHTPFITFLREPPVNGITMNSRMENLLSLTHLEDRLILPEEKIDYNKLFSIDFSISDSLIEKEKEKSILYLKNVLA